MKIQKVWLIVASMWLLSGQHVFAQMVTLTDMSGKEVKLPALAKKVVTIPMPASALQMSVDQGASHLIGMHPEAHRLYQRTLLSTIFPQANSIRTDVTKSGFVPNIETLMQMQPDLIWQWGNMGKDLITPLEQAGLPVAALVYGDESKTQEWIELFGKALGQEANAKAQIAWRRQVKKEIAQKTAAIPHNKKPTVMYLGRYAPQYRVAGKQSNLQHDITLAGGINVSAEVTGSPTINIEQIMAWNPDVILLNNFEANVTPDTLYHDPLFADIAAVKHHRVYKMPAGGYLWDPPNQESPLQWLWLSELLHPDLFHWSLRTRIQEAYQLLYQYAITPKQINTVLHLQLNQKALHYERFQ